jgi:hypothetical protein
MEGPPSLGRVPGRRTLTAPPLAPESEDQTANRCLPPEITAAAINL